MSSAPRKTKSKGSKKQSSSSSTAIPGDKQSRLSRRRRKDVNDEFDGGLSERPESRDAEAWQAAEREARRRERGAARSRIAEQTEQTYAADEYERDEELRRALGDVSNDGAYKLLHAYLSRHAMRDIDGNRQSLRLECWSERATAASASVFADQASRKC